MKKIIFIISLAILFSQCSTNKIKKTGLEVEIKIIKKYDCHNFDGLQGDFYSTIVNLKNNTDSTISFWIMKCTWGENFIFNDDSIGIYYYRFCDSNYPVVKKFEPGKVLTYVDRIVVLGVKNKNKMKKYKLGFILVKEKSISKMGFELLDTICKKKRENKDIIWSNEFTLDN